ncbi:ATP-grasp domain-containing protein [Streptantibioticus silvisoli]|uniref:ATP-grasp domain-containing protein n=1 Tax=Streptantibioticus silvisoli TaxID=2705255 RepID=A0ABT6W8C9_9ACTN|nr:hypothetical protein [Streptantibioticus silvisoli]MDI5966544.1 hypothetical protein [Streptantibioticus silvisoli]
MPKVLLFSRQPLAKRPLHEWLDATGDSVVLITTPKAVAGCEDLLAERFLGHRLVDDYHSWATERIAEEAARTHGVELIASTSESDVLRAARLRERLGLPGQHGDSATAYRDKVAMKRLARAAGLGVPSFTAVDGPMDLLDFVEAEGYPVVVKPRAGSGAEDVAILHGPRDLDAFLGRQRQSPVLYLPGQWMAEGFVRAPFFHVDGIMAGGRVVHGWPSQYNGGMAEYARDESVLSTQLLAPGDERRATLMRLTGDLVAALPASPLPIAFHLEAWIGEDGRAVLCEIACRAGGGLIADTYERAFGVHLAKEGLRAQCGSALSLAEQPPAPARLGGWAYFPPGHGTFVAPAERCPVPGADLTVHRESGARGDGMASVVDAAASVLVTGDSAGEVRERMAAAVTWWHGNARWV